MPQVLLMALSLVMLGVGFMRESLLSVMFSSFGVGSLLPWFICRAIEVARNEIGSGDRR